MIKLRDGWPGFETEEYHPFRYDSRNLLDSIYWDIAKAIPKCTNNACKEKLLRLLRETAPTNLEGKQGGGYKYAIQKNGLVKYFPKLRNENNTGE